MPEEVRARGRDLLLLLPLLRSKRYGKHIEHFYAALRALLLLFLLRAAWAEIPGEIPRICEISRIMALGSEEGTEKARQPW